MPVTARQRRPRHRTKSHSRSLFIVEVGYCCKRSITERVRATSWIGVVDTSPARQYDARTALRSHCTRIRFVGVGVLRAIKEVH